MKIYAPEGSIGRAEHGLAPGVGVLAGRRLLGLDNGKPGADRLLARIGEQLAARTGVVWTGVLRKGSAATPCEEDLLAEIARRADGVVTATAD